MASRVTAVFRRFVMGGHTSSDTSSSSDDEAEIVKQVRPPLPVVPILPIKILRQNTDDEVDVIKSGFNDNENSTEDPESCYVDDYDEDYALVSFLLDILRNNVKMNTRLEKISEQISDTKNPSERKMLENKEYSLNARVVHFYNINRLIFDAVVKQGDDFSRRYCTYMKSCFTQLKYHLESPDSLALLELTMPMFSNYPEFKANYYYEAIIIEFFNVCYNELTK